MLRTMSKRDVTMYFRSTILTRIFETHVKDMLTMMMAECSDAFEMLPAVDNADILRNILYSGVWNSYERRVSKIQKTNNFLL